MSMIANPKKNIVVDKSMSEIKTAIDKIPDYFQKKYTLAKKNELLNLFTFEALEFLSLGVFVDINLNFVSETKTDIIIEVRRKVGAFDQSHEVSKANKHIESMFNGISELIINPNAQPKKKDGCYIATSVYGSYEAPEVIVLRNFRDNYLKKSILGVAFINFYYSTAPTIVKVTKNMKLFNVVVKKILDKFVARLQHRM